MNGVFIKMLKELKKQSVKAVALASVVFMLLGVFLFYITGAGVLNYFRGPIDFSTLLPDDIEGKYVVADIAYIFDSYAYTEDKDEKLVAQEFIIPIIEGVDDDDSVYFMGLAIYDHEELKAANEIFVSTLERIENSVESSEIPYMQIVGTIMPMEKESAQFFKEVALERNGIPEDSLLPFYIQSGYVGNLPFWQMIAYTAVSVALFGFGAFKLIKAFSGGYQRRLKKLFKSDPDGSLVSLEQFYSTATPIHGVRFGKFIMFNSRAQTCVFSARDLLWAYRLEVKNKRNGVSYRTNSVIFKVRGGHTYEAFVGKDEATEILSHVKTTFPQVILGYSSDRQKAYRDNPEDLAIYVRTREVATSNE